MYSGTYSSVVSLYSSLEKKRLSLFWIAFYSSVLMRWVRAWNGVAPSFGPPFHMCNALPFASTASNGGGCHRYAAFAVLLL